MAPATQTKGAFTFTSGQTVGDLLLVAEALEKAGHRPSLRFVRAYRGGLDSVAVDIDDEAPNARLETARARCNRNPIGDNVPERDHDAGEMAVYTPDPRD
jgi:hypothetical protein